MAYFAVAYDLVGQKDYKALTDELERLEAVKAQLSFWLVDLNHTADEVRAHLQRYLDNDDRIMVIEFDKKPSWNVGLKGTRAWIDARF